MIGSVLTVAKGLLDGRFVVNSLVPSALTVLVLGAVVSVDTLGAEGAWSWQESLSAGDRFGIFGGAAFGSFLLAVVLGASEQQVIRIFEGYWGGNMGRRFRHVAISRQRRRLNRLADRTSLGDDSAYAEIYYCYPLPTQVDYLMPTRLGNILKSAELYALDRYGIDPVVIWPRLYHVVPSTSKTLLSSALGSMSLLLNVSLSLVAIGLGSAVYGLITWPSYWAAGASGAAAIGTLACYRLALPSAVMYAEQVRSLFDVYQMDLRSKLGGGEQAAGDERTYWQQRSSFFYRGLDGVDSTRLKEPR